MAIHQRKQTNILLTFKVLQFVNQLRRRVKPRTRDGSTKLCQLGTDVLGLRAIKSNSNGRARLGARNVKPFRYSPRRVCKSRENNAKVFRPSDEPRAPGWHVSAASDTSGEEVQQYV
jgi:hypothetical protein